MSDIDAILDQIDANLPASVDSFLRFLTFASVSGQPDGAAGVAACAAWLRDELESLGLEVSVVPAAGHPLVLATSTRVAGRLRVLLYGHYDVQPAEPLAAWRSPPFEPVVMDEDGLRRIYARGASDSKSQVWSVIEALRAWKAVEGGYPVDLTLLLEGEEETGSPSLPAFIDAHRDRLACDVAFISDSDMWSRTRPAITTRLKGLLHEKITITAPNGDLHSGHFGNVAVNPVRVLAQILASLHDDLGRVTVAGFYEGVQPVPAPLREQWEALDLDAALSGVSIVGGHGAGGHGPVELMWAHPGIDFNGIIGGNTGPGERSVLPASASARLSVRLVGGQRPDRIRSALRDHVRAQVPVGCRVDFDGDGGCAAVSLNEASRFIAATVRALDAEWPEPTLIKGTGGAIPLVGLLSERLGVDCVVTGFILADDAIHAPNERYDIDRLRRGIRSWARILCELGAETPGSP